MASCPLSRFLVTVLFCLSLFAVPSVPRSPEPRALPSFTQTLLSLIFDQGRERTRHRPQIHTKEGGGIDPTGGTPKPPCSGVCG
jgi:hypothetical protein